MPVSSTASPAQSRTRCALRAMLARDWPTGPHPSRRKSPITIAPTNIVTASRCSACVTGNRYVESRNAWLIARPSHHSKNGSSTNRPSLEPVIGDEPARDDSQGPEEQRGSAGHPRNRGDLRILVPPIGVPIGLEMKHQRVEPRQHEERELGQEEHVAIVAQRIDAEKEHPGGH